MNLQTIILISRSGGGKGTQARELIKYIKTKDDRNTFHMQSGERIRSFLEETSYAAKLAQEIGSAGELQPSFLSVWAWSGEIIKKLDKDEHLIVDGAPRRSSEASLITEALKFFKRENPKVVYINVSNDWSKKRLLERSNEEEREDDARLESINKRLKWFDDDVLPAIDYLKKTKYYEVYEVNGEQSIEDVHKEIVKALGI